MAELPIHYFNRYSGRVETEQVYGEGFLRFAYGNPLGRIALHLLVRRRLFSRWYGWRMDRPASRQRVAPFIQRYGVETRDFSAPPESFQTFNEFFYRRLKPGSRPIARDPEAAVFPADGRHLGFQDLSKIQDVFVKGQRFNLETLLGNRVLAERYREGSAVLSRLCPVDYHRFHFPVDGTPTPPQLIEGPLYSVNPLALRRNLGYLLGNRRWWNFIAGPTFGVVVMLEIGATCVGATDYTFPRGPTVRRGDEKGFFKFGGSSVITLFPPGRIRLADDLLENTRQQREIYARMGDFLGTRIG